MNQPSLKSYRITSTKISSNANDENITTGPIFKSQDELNISVIELRAESNKASKRASDAEAVVEDLESRIQEAEINLLDKDKLIKVKESIWDVEKGNLLEKISDFTNLLTQKDQEVGEKTEALKADAEAKESLLKSDIKLLKESLSQAQAAMEQECANSDEVKDRLLNAEDSFEFEQMKYEKIKKELSAKINEEKGNYSKEQEKNSLLQDRMNDELSQMSQQFEESQLLNKEEKRRLEDQIKEGERIRRYKTIEMGRRYTRIREEMTGLWREAKSDKKKMETKLKNRLKDKDNAIARITEEVENAILTQEELRQNQEKIAKERDNAIEIQNDMEREFVKSLDEREMAIKSLENSITKLEGDKEENRDEIESLKDTIKILDNTRKMEEKRMSEELARIVKEKELLENDVEAGRIELAETTKRLNKRVDDVRQEMTGMLIAAKSEARKEEEKMKQKYDKQLDESWNATKSLRVKLDRVKEEQLEAKEEIRVLDLKLVDRVVSVKKLEVDVKKRDETIDRYESNYRELLKLSLKLTKNRLKSGRSKVGNAVGRIINRRKKDKKSIEDQ